MQRINWQELLQHPVWTASQPIYTFKKRTYAEQPQFAEYARNCGIPNLEQFYKKRFETN